MEYCLNVATEWERSGVLWHEWWTDAQLNIQSIEETSSSVNRKRYDLMELWGDIKWHALIFRASVFFSFLENYVKFSALKAVMSMLINLFVKRFPGGHWVLYLIVVNAQFNLPSVTCKHSLNRVYTALQCLKTTRTMNLSLMLCAKLLLPLLNTKTLGRNIPWRQLSSCWASLAWEEKTWHVSQTPVQIALALF